MFSGLHSASAFYSTMCSIASMRIGAPTLQTSTWLMMPLGDKRLRCDAECVWDAPVLAA